MAWAENRIEEYKQGQEASFLEKIMVGYLNPVTYTLLITGGLKLVYGLWARNWSLIILGGLASTVVGNLYSWLSGWTDDRIADYASGDREPKWLEKRCLEEAHPMSFSTRVIAGVFFIKGLWNHNWRSIGFGFFLGMLGRVIPWIEK